MCLRQSTAVNFGVIAWPEFGKLGLALKEELRLKKNINEDVDRLVWGIGIKDRVHEKVEVGRVITERCEEVKPKVMRSPGVGNKKRADSGYQSEEEND